MDRLCFAPTTLIIGTFNPGWHNLNNAAGWFYGRTQNNYFWEVLPKLYGQPSLRQAPPCVWKEFCQDHKIALTDLIYCLEDADISNVNHIAQLKNYRDDLIAKHFSRIDWVNIVNLLQQHNSIKHVYLTRKVNDKFWRLPWQTVEDHCSSHDIISRTLLTPSGGARFQMPKDCALSLGEFIFERWRQNWHELSHG